MAVGCGDDTSSGSCVCQLGMMLANDSVVYRASSDCGGE